MSARTAASLRCRYTVALVLTWMTAVVTRASKCRGRSVDGLVTGEHALVDGGGEILVLDHDQQLRLGGRVQVQGADRNIGPIGDLLRRDPADAVLRKQPSGRGHDPLALVLLGPLAAPDRHVPVFHVVPS